MGKYLPQKGSYHRLMKDWVVDVSKLLDLHHLHLLQSGHGVDIILIFILFLIFFLIHIDLP
jgi:hypothetical protein